ncbi:hypothetical protein [Streptomyces sudanensis]|uniref:hypothetical protein n=1 Tax=Streptomyces sudanensis TaxID=436397 RepID=UPI0035584755
MIVSTSARSATGLAALLLLALLPPLLVLSSVASAAAPRPSEPKPPRPGARADPALLHRSGTQVRLPRAPPRHPPCRRGPGSSRTPAPATSSPPATPTGRWRPRPP